MIATKICLIDDDATIRKSISLLLEAEGMQVVSFPTWNDESRHALTEQADVAIVDVFLREADGRTALRDILKENPHIPVIMISGQASPEEGLEAVRSGAFDFLEKPIKPDRLIVTIGNAARFAKLREGHIRQIIPVADSQPMRTVINRVRRVAVSSSTVLVNGESGTGKDLVARLIHRLSPRADGPWVQINCGSIPETLVESELFGHVRGAFTGAVADYSGKIAQSDGGSLFMDEIGELPLSSQAKLLRFLETGEIQRVGDNKTRKTNTRIIAATHRDLAAMVAKGAFREDLWYRLNILPLDLPPLRERVTDIGPLCMYFLQESSARLGFSAPEPDESALQALEAWPWPGNVRELRNLVERLVLFFPGEKIQATQIAAVAGRSSTFNQRSEGGTTPDSMPDRETDPLFTAKPLTNARDEFEKAYLSYHLIRLGYSVQATAAALSLLPNNLSRRLKQLGIQRDTLSR